MAVTSPLAYQQTHSSLALYLVPRQTLQIPEFPGIRQVPVTKTIAGSAESCRQRVGKGKRVKILGSKGGKSATISLSL
jgi:hypothetical protein